MLDMKNHPFPVQKFILSLVIGSSAVLLLACGDKKVAPAAAGAKAIANPMDVTLTPEMAHQFKIAPLEMQELTPWVEIAGRIEANDQLVTRIGASVTGRVTEVLGILHTWLYRKAALWTLEMSKRKCRYDRTFGEPSKVGMVRDCLRYFI